MKTNHKSVLMLATSSATRGGISSVLNIYRQCPFWQSYHIRWIETHANGSLWLKCLYALRSFCLYLCLVPAYKIVHIHLSEVPSMLRKLPFFLVAKLYRKKVVLHFHSFDPSTTIDGPFRRLYRFMFAHTDSLIVLSPSWKQWMQDYLSLSAQVQVIYTPAPDITHPPDDSLRQPMILYAGALNRRKGYADLLRAFATVHSQSPGWHLVLAGDGEIDQGRQLAATLGLGECVRFAGWIRGEEKARLFAEASIFCQPTYAEGFPMALLEACAYGLPIVTTPVGGIPDIIQDGANGLLFTPGDISALVACLQQLIKRPALRLHLGAACRRLSQSHFSPQIVARQISALYDSL